MSGDISDAGRCEVFRDELAELALGTLSGRSRSEALDHVASCQTCAAELERLSIVADQLLQLAPEMEPPLGFELRLAEKLQGAAMARRPKRFRRARRACRLPLRSWSSWAVALARLSHLKGKPIKISRRRPISRHCKSHVTRERARQRSLFRPAGRVDVRHDQRRQMVGRYDLRRDIGRGQERKDRRVQDLAAVMRLGTHVEITSANEVRSARLIAKNGNCSSQCSYSNREGVGRLGESRTGSGVISKDPART